MDEESLLYISFIMKQVFKNVVLIEIPPELFGFLFIFEMGLEDMTARWEYPCQ